MSGRHAQRRLAPAETAVAAAWERFAAGDEVVDGIRPEILDSWLRCRDEHRVDPQRDRAPLAEQAPPPGAEESVVAAELGAAAARLAPDVEAVGGVVAVADGRGRVLATWGEGPSARRGGEQNLGPLFSWAEPSTGTTGVGTALASRGLVSVNRFEHWCAAFHDWSCAALAVRDPATGAPVGAIDISVWDRPLPQAAAGWLQAAVAAVEERLRLRAALGVATPTAPPPHAGPGPDRLVGVRGSRLVLVPVERVRAVTTEDGLLWLDTEDGRLRSPARGLEELEARLEARGFLRVSRQALVNLARVHEISPGFKGGLFLHLDGGGDAVAVSRRRAQPLRAALGL